MSTQLVVLNVGRIMFGHSAGRHFPQPAIQVRLLPQLPNRHLRLLQPVEACSAHVRSVPDNGICRWPPPAFIYLLNINMLRNIQRIIQPNSRMPNVAFQFYIAKQQLDGTKVLGTSLNQSGPGSTHLVHHLVLHCLQTPILPPPAISRKQIRSR